MKKRFKFDAIALFIGLCGIVGILATVAIVLYGVEFLINIAR